MSQCLYLWMPIFVSGSAIRCTCSQKVAQWGEPWIQSLQQIKPRDNLAVACKKLSLSSSGACYFHVDVYLVSLSSQIVSKKKIMCSSELYEIAYGFCFSVASQHPVKQFQILLLMSQTTWSHYCTVLQILNDAHTS